MDLLESFGTDIGDMSGDGGPVEVICRLGLRARMAETN